MKLALTIQTPEVQPAIPVALLTGTFIEKLNKAAQLGAEGVELMTTDPADLDGDLIRAGLQQHNLRATAVGSGAVAFATGLTLLHADPAKSELARLRLRQLINFAADVAAPLVTIGSFRGRLASVASGGYEQLAAMLFEAANYAQTRNVRLVIEPLNRYETDVILNAAEGLAFINEVNHPSLGLLLDTYHVNIEESSWTEPFRRVMAAGRLWHVHLGDNNRLPPGCGLIDFPAIVQTLHEVDYQGCLSAELLARPDPDTAASQTISYMRTLLLET